MTGRLPELSLADWRPTRDTLHQYARIVGKIRSRYSPKSKHWWHITLDVSARGLTTTPFPIAGQSVELTLDLAAHRLAIDSGDGWSATLPLVGQGPAGLCRQVASTLSAHAVEVDTDLLAAFDDEAIPPYDVDAIARFRQVVNWADGAFETFKGGLREETSPVQLFPHHMDLAMNWFSGRRVPGIDPADEEAGVGRIVERDHLLEVEQRLRAGVQEGLQRRLVLEQSIGDPIELPRIHVLEDITDEPAQAASMLQPVIGGPLFATGCGFSTGSPWITVQRSKT